MLCNLLRDNEQNVGEYITSYAIDPASSAMQGFNEADSASYLVPKESP